MIISELQNSEVFMPLLAAALLGADAELQMDMVGDGVWLRNARDRVGQADWASAVAAVARAAERVYVTRQAAMTALFPGGVYRYVQDWVQESIISPATHGGPMTEYEYGWVISIVLAVRADSAALHE